jgi:ABC-type multidrug transport system fused ATPase/permease subunit
LKNVEVIREPGLAPLQVSLKVEPGERVSISGAEQDTTALVDSIFGLRAPSAGVIEMDGHDVRDLALRELRSRVSLVRGAELFPGCVLDNLRAANPELTAEHAWEALGRVGLAEAVKSLPSGLQTPILRDGAPLSRSQGIALTIARAVAAKPSLLILDRTLDRIDPDAGVRIADRLSAMRDSSLLIVSEDSAVRERMDRHLQVSDPFSQEGEAA